MIVVRLTVLMCIFSIVNSWYDHTGKSHKWTLKNLGKELLADSINKVRQTVDIRREHSRFFSYEIGFIMGQIREKFKFMMELYRLMHNRYTKRWTQHTPMVTVYNPIDYFKKYELIHTLEVEIDKLVEVLETSFVNVEPFPSLYEFSLRSGVERGDGAATALREGEERTDSESSEEQKQKALEEAVKSRYREEYLMRKLNSPGQSTTKKRFVEKWPVPGTWSLEAY